MSAFYNDTERFACDWLQHLMDAGEIMPGKIDDRSIADLSPDDLAGFERVHLFAGIGGWELALRISGWGSDPVWTCSCPCPPFSQAGKRQHCPRCEGSSLVWCPRRTGYCICADCGNAWSADARHLWPEAWRLISRCRPPVVFGEQVASADGLGWLAGVRASLEIISYAPWGVDYPAAGVGAPNIRQRLFWVADAEHRAQRNPRELGASEGCGVREVPRQGARVRFSIGDSAIRGLADADGGLARHGDLQPGRQHGQQPQDGGAGGLANRSLDGWREEREIARRGDAGDGAEELAAGPLSGGESDRLVDAQQPRLERHGGHGHNSGQPGRHDADETGSVAEASATRPWSLFDIVHCTDGKVRRIPQSSLQRLADGLSDGVVRGGFEGAEGFPLAEEARNRVGRLRGYGNAINAYAAAEVIRTWREVRRA
jgi:DNA (cytosine-5)-methyltransferase 1